MKHHTASTPAGAAGYTIHLSTAGLTLLCVLLVAVSSWGTHRIQSHYAAKQVAEPAATPSITKGDSQLPPWGDLRTSDIDIEQPVEYVSFEETLKDPISWVFTGMSIGQVRTAMTEAGLGEAQVRDATSPECVKDSAGATTIQPPENLVRSLDPATRCKLYSLLAQWPENKLMQAPYHLDPERFSDLCLKSGLDGETVKQVLALSYGRSDFTCFSDVGIVLRSLPDENKRRRLLQCLTYQKVVLAYLHVDKDTDIDKLVGYWCATPGVRAKDLRPLLESLKRSPNGETISLLYVLPHFARERLFTFPLPTQAGDPKMDCHWSALNFNNEPPDNRLQDNDYASDYIRKNLYSIGKPSMCGDLVFLTDNKGEVIHSAVYVADDIVFTKNGVNFGQPWVLMRMDSLKQVYTGAWGEPKALFYRRKES